MLTQRISPPPFFRIAPLTFPTEFPLDTTYCIAPTYGFLLDDAGRSPYP